MFIKSHGLWDITEVYANRGYTYYKKGNFENALKDYNRAIELDPNNAGYYNSRGTTYRKSKRYDKEEKDYKKALELDPNYDVAMLNLSELNIMTKNYMDAHEMAEKALNIAKGDDEIMTSHFMMICSSLFQNEKEDAKTQLDRLIEHFETIKDWKLEWDFSEIKPVIESSEFDEEAKSLMLTLIELLKNKITLDEFKSTSAALL
ncbi:MAG TPA: tetratricopeptide repeat protein [Desulfobacteria bacterium]|nr:tetratricopeptide repeat protein [Desulfobacteria bacterium]